MKKRNVVLYAGVLSMVMLSGCGGSTSTETSTPVTQEATEAPEVTEEATTENEEQNTSTEETTEENTSAETEVQEETADTNSDSSAELSSIMAEIYAVKSDAASAETVAENFKNYAFTYGKPSSSTTFEAWANDWFKEMEGTEGKDIRSEFSECFQTVTSTAQKMDETLETDVAYSNVVNGILAAIGE